MGAALQSGASLLEGRVEDRLGGVELVGAERHLGEVVGGDGDPARLAAPPELQGLLQQRAVAVKSPLAMHALARLLRAIPRAHSSRANRARAIASSPAAWLRLNIAQNHPGGVDVRQRLGREARLPGGAS